MVGVLSGSEAKLDDGAGVGNQFGLPAIVGLELLHGGFGLGVPVAGGFAGEVAGFDQRGLNLGGAGVVDSTLSCGFVAALECLWNSLGEWGRGGHA